MKKLLLLIATVCCGTMSSQTLLINEVMQSNIDYIMDDLNDYPDSWVELYNPTDAAINLQDYKIGTKNKVAKAWQLPSQMVAPKQYVLIYCDKAGEDEGVSALHTDFRLESGKDGNIYLFKGNDVADKLEAMAKQPAPNIAYGRETDGGDTWGYELKPTPGAKNKGGVVTAKKLLGSPVFSQEGQVFENGSSFSLKLSLPDGAPEGAEIRYTNDGSEPTATSLVYKNPLTIGTTKIIRAKVFCEGYLSPRSTCHSYIFFPSSRPLTLPVISIMTDDKHLNDSKIGIYSDAKYTDGQANYTHNWRRPINIEMFEKSGQPSVFNQLGETRIAGGATRSAARKTFAVYANKRFGTKRFDYEFFPDQKPGLKNFKSFMLRNAGNDFDYLFMRDAVIQRTMASHVDLDWQAWRPAIVYINGQYTGMLNIRERSNEDNIYNNYDELEDIDMIENWNELKEGTMDSFNEFKAFYGAHGHTLAEYAERMDWEEFINVMLADLYYINLDAPGNNFVMWRPQADGGKWRFVLKDTDFGLGLYDCSPSYEVFQWLYNPSFDGNHNWGANGYEGTRLFRRLMEDKDFEREFIDRASIYAGDFMNEKGTLAFLEPMYDMIKTEYPFHRKPINEWWPNYNEELNKARNFVKKRTNYFYRQLGIQYNLGLPLALTINKATQADIQLTFNGIKVSEKVFDGQFFVNRDITLSATSNDESKVVTGWKVTGYVNQDYQGSTLTMKMPSGATAIQPILGSADGIDEIEYATPALSKDEEAVYDLQGRKVTTPQAGRIYIQNGKKIMIK